MKKLEKSQHTPAKHKQEISKYKTTVKKLEQELIEANNRTKNNQIYRETYELIGTKSSELKQSIKEIFCHNFNVWLKQTGLSNIQVAKKYKLDKSLVTDFKNYRVGPTVASIQLVDEVLCDYFECSVYELVTVRLEGKK